MELQGQTDPDSNPVLLLDALGKLLDFLDPVSFICRMELIIEPTSGLLTGTQQKDKKIFN